MFPPDFPDEFVRDAFIAGSEAAWPPQSVARVIRWFRKNGIAVLGTELWVVRDGTICPGILVKGVQNIYGNDVSPRPDEHWESYAVRSADETLQYVNTLRLPPEAKEQGDIFFNVTWASESDFQELRASQ